MFWKFDLNTTSHVDKLLEKEDVTLRELMDEDDVLQECKAQNRKLVDFLCRQPCMEELVQLITRQPPLDVDEKVRFKYVSSFRPARVRGVGGPRCVAALPQGDPAGVLLSGHSSSLC